MLLEDFLSSVGPIGDTKSIVCIKGSHGSGKSTVVSSLLANPIEIEENNRLPVLTYSREMGLVALGQYRVGSTGCDGIKKTSEIKRLISLLWAKDVDIIYEGILPSLAMSTYHDLSASLGVRYGVFRRRLYVYLDVQEQDCEQRILMRRWQKYNRKPLNVLDMKKKYERIMNSVSYYKDRPTECDCVLVSGYGKPVRVANRVLSVMRSVGQ